MKQSSKVLLSLVAAGVLGTGPSVLGQHARAQPEQTESEGAPSSDGSTPNREPQQMVVIVHPDTAEGPLGRVELSAIYRSVRREWPGGERIVAFNQAPRSGQRTAFDHAVLRMDPEAVTRFWIDERIRGGGRPPRAVPSEELMVRVIAEVPGAIGYVSADQSLGAVRVVARIVDNEVVEP